MNRPPKFVQGFIDRHGKPRFYFRRPGFKSMPLPGLPWSPEFMASYETAMAGQPAQIGAAKVKPGTMRALAVSYYGSIGFRSMKESTQSVYRNIIDKFCRETDKDGKPHADKNAATIKREHVVKLMAGRAEQPESANGLRKVLRAMMQHAVEIGLRADDPTQDVRAIRVKSDGFHSWTDDEIAQFEAKAPGRIEAAAGIRPPALHRPAAFRCGLRGPAAHPGRRLAGAPSQDRRRIDDPAACRARQDPWRGFLAT